MSICVSLLAYRAKRAIPKCPFRIGRGSVEVIQVHQRKYQKQRFVERLLGTIVSNMALLRSAFASMCVADLVVFTEARR
jgi:hypothetical protein